ncbi:MAG: toll/interleukin-1 receptor domain-containing protein, partial [Proteobacteria bacterium]|nr:toll/interleukin-1 receptor domain-containing protein [Pseudomonadota bacterium]
MNRSISTESQSVPSLKQGVLTAQRSLLRNFLRDISDIVEMNSKFLPQSLSPDHVRSITHPKIFISYAWEEEGSARVGHLQKLLRRLAEDLRSAGLNPWLDLVNLSGDIDAQMREGIATSQHVLAIGSKRYAQRTLPGSGSNARKELDLALDRAKGNKNFLLPLIIEGYSYHRIEILSSTAPRTDLPAEGILYLTLNSDQKTASMTSLNDSKPLDLKQSQYESIIDFLKKNNQTKATEITDSKLIDVIRGICKIKNRDIIFPELGGCITRDCSTWFDINIGKWLSMEAYIKALTKCDSDGILYCLLGLTSDDYDLANYLKACRKQYKQCVESLNKKLSSINSLADLDSKSISPTPEKDRDLASPSAAPKDEKARAYVKEAQALWKQKEYQAAYELYELAVNLNYPKAFTCLGLCKLKGQGASENKPEAYKLFEQAAKMGEIEAMRCLAEMLSKGDGIPKNKEQGNSWRNKYEKGKQLKSTSSLLSSNSELKHNSKVRTRDKELKYNSESKINLTDSETRSTMVSDYQLRSTSESEVNHNKSE